MSEKRRQEAPRFLDAFVARVRARRAQGGAWWRDVEPQRLMRLVSGVLEGHGDPVDKTATPGPGRVVLDADAWLAWVEVGFRLFALRPGTEPDDIWTGPVRTASVRGGPALPALQSFRCIAQRVAIVLAMLRHHGNLSHAAQALWVSRRALRGQLKAAGLYPWPTAPEADALDFDEGTGR